MRELNGTEVSGVAFTWTSSNAAVASVDSTGLVSAIAVGDAQIRATSGDVSGSASIQVVESLTQGVLVGLRGPSGTGSFMVEVSGGELSQAIWERVLSVTGDSARITLGLPEGGPYRVRAYAIDARTNPTSAYFLNVIGLGRQRDIEVTSGSQTELTVSANAVAITGLTAPDTVGAFEAATVTWEIEDSTGLVGEFYGDVGYGVQSWGSDRNWSNATGSSRELTATGYRYRATIPEQVSAGLLYWQASVGRSASGSWGNNELRFFAPSISRGEPLETLTITDQPVGVGAPVASILVAPDGASLGVGQSVQALATPLDSLGRALADRTVTWSVDDPGVATVSSDGVVTAVAEGDVQIRAEVEGVEGVGVVSVITAQTSSGLDVRLSGPAGTGSFFVQVSGGSLDQEVTARVTGAVADTAQVFLALPSGGPYRIRTFAVDETTNPLSSNRVQVTGVGEVRDVMVSAGVQTDIGVAALSTSLTLVESPDTVEAFSSARIVWDVDDPTGVLRQSFSRGVSFGTTPWGQDYASPDRTGASGQEVISPSVVRYESLLPGQPSAGTLYWQLYLEQYISGAWGDNRLILTKPTIAKGEPLNTITVVNP